jgi:hypothetical protein
VTKVNLERQYLEMCKEITELRKRRWAFENKEGFWATPEWVDEIHELNRKEEELEKRCEKLIREEFGSFSRPA